MFLKYYQIPLSAALVFLFVSCANRKCCLEVYDPDPAKASKATKLMLKKADFFKTRVADKCKTLGVCITNDSYKLYNHRFNKLAARCALLGINMACLECKMDKIRDSEHAEMLRALIAALHRRKIKTIAILESPRLFANENAIGKYLKNITSFNNDAESQDEKFDGILADTRPDLMTGKSPRYTNGVLYHWSPYSYGKGRDNDMLMKDTFSMLTELKKEMPDGMDLGQGISPCYEEEFRKGALSCGGVNEFLASCDFVALFCFSSDRREIYNLSSNTLKFARKKSSVLICAKTVVSKYGGADKDESLSWKSWFKFVKDIEYVSDNSSSYESFGGMIFYDFNGLERMLE